MSNAVPYRQMAQKAIRRVIESNPASRLSELRRKIRSAYPFGYPDRQIMQVWNDEVARLLATRKRPKRCSQ
ncbi:hypothetical protein GCM10027299_28860 [Larkinella ripae]